MIQKKKKKNPPDLIRIKADAEENYAFVNITLNNQSTWVKT